MAEHKPDVLQGTLDLIALKLLRAGRANGWQVTEQRAVERDTWERFSAALGTILDLE